MTELAPCTACRRHVAVAETACPFCGVALPARAAEPFAAQRLARAAVFVAGAALVGAGLASCWTSSSPRDSKVVDHKTTADAGVGDAPPDPDVEDNTNRQRHPGGGGCVSPGNGQPPVCMPYGAPPARRRVV